MVEDELERELERMADDIAGRPDDADLARRFEWLVDLLIMRGHLLPAYRRLVDKVRAADRRPISLAQFRDKRSMPGTDIDCASRIHLCKARCCSFAVTLSEEDVVEGKLRFDLNEPYRIERDKRTRYCRYLKADGGCSTYEDRPATCRIYDCREDTRVWIDFEKAIPAPMPENVIPIDEW